MTTVEIIARKFRRALRNGTGLQLTLGQLQELAGYGVLDLIVKIEAQELCPPKTFPALSETTGSISNSTASALIGKPKAPQPKLNKASLAALMRNI